MVRVCKPQRILLNGITQGGTTSSMTINKTKQAREELKQKTEDWKKKIWIDFCRLVMEADTRYTLMPMTDYNKRMGNHSMTARVANAEGVFSNFCLTRTGELNDVYLLPSDPQLGVLIDAGSKYGKAMIFAFPSKGVLWSVLKLADELERQYVREVKIATNKYSPKGGKNVKRTSGDGSNSNTDELSTDSNTD